MMCGIFIFFSWGLAGRKLLTMNTYKWCPHFWKREVMVQEGWESLPTLALYCEAAQQGWTDSGFIS